MNKVSNIYGVPQRTAAQRSDKKKAPAKEPIFTREYLICTFSFTMLLLQNLGGSKAILGFLLPWSFLLFRRFFYVVRGFEKFWPLFLLPAFSTMSALWSATPEITLRGGLEYLATVAIGIMAGYCVKPRVLMAALLTTLIIIAICSMAAGRTEIISTTGEHAYTGIFGSKNAYAMVMSLLLLVSVSVYLDKVQSTFFRVAALGGVLLTPILIHLGRSLGSTLSACFAIAIYFSVRFLTRFAPKTRLFIALMIFLVGASLVMLVSVTDFHSGSILTSVGKDATLTGRTYLWRRGIAFAGDHPLLGVGSGSFWRMDNPRAQELWYNSHVPIGSGLGFHSEYINMLVELGLVGLGIMLGYFYTLSKSVLKRILSTMTTEQNFVFILFIYFMIRTPVETTLFGQFNIAGIIFCVMWIYFYPASKENNRGEYLKSPKRISLKPNPAGN